MAALSVVGQKGFYRRRRGAEAVPRGQGRAPPAGPGGAATASRPWPVGGPPSPPFGPRVSSVLNLNGASEIEIVSTTETGAMAKVW